MPHLQAGHILCTDGVPGHSGVALRGLGGHTGDAGFISHAMGGYDHGILKSPNWPFVGRVYRPTQITAERLGELFRCSEILRESTRYGIARAIFKSIFGTSAFTGSASARLQKYRTRLANFTSIAEDQGRPFIVKNVICSEYVILLFQLSAPDETDPYFINLNAKHTLPMGLERWLRQHTELWQYVGRTTGAREGLEYVTE